MKESQLQSKIIKYLESKGAYVVRVIAASKNGVPDLIVCYKGNFIAIEVKAPGKKNTVTELQKINAVFIESAEGTAWVIDDLEELKIMMRHKFDS